MKVLIVEDDIECNERIKRFFNLLKYEVLSTFDGYDAISLIDEKKYNLYILDINLPNINGLEILKYIRNKDIKSPIIMITASHDMEIFIEAYTHGCDEFIRKPFHLKELELRIKYLFDTKQSDLLIITEHMSYNFDFEELIIKGEVIKLRKKLNRLLQVLLRNMNHTVSTQDIESYVWENEIKDSYPLRQLIADLRKEFMLGKNHIISDVGVGYKFETI